ncbi:pilus assembly protein [Pseudomonas protegens]|uniref:fimbrial biogenesis chaperone n=1 Tax=Pseudomonas protegens TaxID=380021 RepID=UPI000F4C52B2|nr:molecular chaperone [Pseudomonas protegens]ROL74337.1 pilus assembly protein [Pseudomonas protegens]
MNTFLRLRSGLTHRNWLFCAALITLWPDSQASAGIMLSGTRIILNAEQHSVSTIVSNLTGNDITVQTWVSDVKDSKDSLTPFIALPALFKVRAGEEQVVRIIKTPGPLPEDRESLFYFNAQEIPLLDHQQGNPLKVVQCTRAKLFYRPGNLPGTPQEAPSQLQWKLLDQPSGTVLRVTNPSAYHVTFMGLRIMGGGRPIELNDVGMVTPRSSQDYRLNHKLKSTTATVEFSIINDYGGYSDPIKSSVRF